MVYASLGRKKSAYFFLNSKNIYKKGEKVRIFSATPSLHTFMDG